MLPRDAYSVGAVGHPSDDPESPGFEQGVQAFKEYQMVISKEDAW